MKQLNTLSYDLHMIERTHFKGQCQEFWQVYILVSLPLCLRHKAFVTPNSSFKVSPPSPLFNNIFYDIGANSGLVDAKVNVLTALCNVISEFVFSQLLLYNINIDNYPNPYVIYSNLASSQVSINFLGRNMYFLLMYLYCFSLLDLENANGFNILWFFLACCFVCVIQLCSPGLKLLSLISKP